MIIPKKVDRMEYEMGGIAIEDKPRSCACSNFHMSIRLHNLRESPNFQYTCTCMQHFACWLSLQLS